MTKIQLKLEEDFDFDLIGISCHQKDYRLSFEINKHLEIDLQRDNDLVITKKNLTASFSLSLFIDEENHQEYYLIANKGTNGFLIPEQKSSDFFLLIKGVIQEDDIDNLLEGLKSIDIILAAYLLKTESLKSKTNLIF